MQKPENGSEEFVEKVFKESSPTAATNDEERIARTIAGAQRQTNTRDAVLFVFVRFWMVLNEITCKLFVKSSKYRSMKNP